MNRVQFCWNCESPLHHRRDCPQPRNDALKREIQAAYRRGEGREQQAARNAAQLMRLAAKEDFRDPSRVPITVLKKEVERLSQFIYDNQPGIEALPRSVSADCVLQAQQDAEALLQLWKTEEETIRFVYASRYNYFKPNEGEWTSDEGILFSKIQTIHDLSLQLRDMLYDKTNRLKGLRYVIDEITQSEANLREFIQSGMMAYSERSLNIPSVLQQWDTKKKVLKNVLQAFERNGYLFAEVDSVRFRTSLENIKDGWKTLKAAKKDFDSELSKIQCNICITNDVDAVIDPCMHTICKQCASKMPSCPVCRGLIRRIRDIYF